MPGYPKLANLMAASADMAIFRQFRQLQMINLLRLQAKLQVLENEYAEVRAEDATSCDRDRVDFARDFQLMDKVAGEEDGESEQHDILENISRCLKEYNEALAQVMALSKAPRPNIRDICDLRKWLDRPSMGEGFLVGIEAGTWHERNDSDLISPMSDHLDKLSTFLTGPILSGYHWLYGHKKERLRVYDEKGMMIVFTAVFAATLALVTNAKRVEIFSATAAFAAVEVVFIGSTGGAAS
ncbi:hypothetical protein QBC39DRAFT_326316 [Podospora conica]|nr:hypothetical protein QBC39DRAFT_326316 [Schizothecium conicum]